MSVLDGFLSSLRGNEASLLEGRFGAGVSRGHKKVRILSSFPAMGAMTEEDGRFEHEYIGEDMGLISALKTVWRARWSADVLLLNIDHRRLFAACLVSLLTGPRPLRRCRIVSVDALFRPPSSVRERIAALGKRLLLTQVDQFILYFKDVDGYARHFGVPRERTEYVPFKVNSWEQLRVRRTQIDEGEYVLLAGATLRDRRTFVEAIRLSKLPALLVVPGDARHEIEQTDWFRAGLPPSLRIEYHTDGAERTYLSYFERARIVCLPRFCWDIASTGISAYLCAMGLGKCVVISRGPGAEDVLAEHEAALFFEAGNVSALAQVLKRAWDDAELRRRVACNGARYAESLQGEERLMRDILALVSGSGVGAPQQQERAA